MKDLYTFDKDKEEAMRTYAEVSQQYKNLFQELNVPYAKGFASIPFVRLRIHFYLI